MGESPELCVSGSHQPALAWNAVSEQGDPIIAFAYQTHDNISKSKMQVKNSHFPFLDGKTAIWYVNDTKFRE